LELDRYARTALRLASTRAKQERFVALSLHFDSEFMPREAIGHRPSAAKVSIEKRQ
jgi:hypothetical protein